MKKKIILIIVFLFVILLLCFGSFHFSKIKITLNGDEKTIIHLGEEYKDEGAKAKILFFNIGNVKVEDNVDTSKLGSYKVTYKYKFLYKNATKERTIEVVDGEKPVLELKGRDNIKIYVNGSYNEAGYTATDNIDGDITDKVTVKNDINLEVAGTYKVTYEVLDSSNNRAYMERIVEVMPRPEKNASGVPVLMYHFFYDPSKEDHSGDGNWMDIVTFEEEVKYLVDNDYYFPTWQEVIDYLDGKITLPEKSVVITADDSDPSFFTYAVPIIQKYDVYATSFVIGYYYGGPMDPIDNIYYESHTYDMHRAGCSGMGHGGILNCIDHDSGVADLKRSIEVIGDNKAIAYPFGDVNENTKTITRDAGIQLGFTTAWGRIRPGMDKLELPRIRVSGGISIDSFAKRLQ